MQFWPSYLIVFITAIIPAIVWAIVFLKQHKENRWLVLLTFIGGMLAAKIILIYQGYWDTTFNFIFFKVSFVDFRSNITDLVSHAMLSAFFIFVGVGAMEEFLKFWMMKTIDSKFFRSIDDVIMFSIVSALGFAFLENIIYFMHHFGKLGTGTFLLFAMSRVTVVTMVHVLCSGILGYYFGMAFFASPVLRMQYAKKKRHPVLEFLHRVLHLKKEHLYHDQMLVIGLVLSMLIHAMYDFLLTAPFMRSPLMLIMIMFTYFFGGYTYLSYLLRRKDLHLKLGLISPEAELQQRGIFFRQSRKQSRFKN